MDILLESMKLDPILIECSRHCDTAIVRADTEDLCNESGAAAVLSEESSLRVRAYSRREPGMYSRPQIDSPKVVVSRAIDSGCCWCGADDRDDLRSDYAQCQACSTVIYTEPYDRAAYASGEAGSFYDDRYWSQHVPEVLGLPRLEQRARADLPERAVFQLEKVLRYLAPGARILELGCGAGSLTYLLQQAGFIAQGLELGPSAIELARSRFGLEMVRGPLEVLPTEGRFDAIVAIDVLEHLPDPLATMTNCVQRLEDDGLLFLQTPCYRGEGADWHMLLPREHLFLFTPSSVERLLDAVGCRSVTVEDSLFPHDMWVVASPQQMLEARADPLAGLTPIALALIDARAETLQLGEDRDGIDADRQAKAVVVERLAAELEAVRVDQQAKQILVDRQHDELGKLKQDQHAKQALVDRQHDELEKLKQDQHAKQVLVDRQYDELEKLRRDQQAKARLIDRLDDELTAIRDDHEARGELVERLSLEIEQVRADQQAKEDAIQQLDSILRQRQAELESAWNGQRVVEAALQDKEATAQAAYAQLEQQTSELQNTESQLAEMRQQLAILRADPLFRLGELIRALLGRKRR